MYEKQSLKCFRTLIDLPRIKECLKYVWNIFQPSNSPELSAMDKVSVETHAVSTCVRTFRIHNNNMSVITHPRSTATSFYVVLFVFVSHLSQLFYSGSFVVVTV